MSEKEDLGAYIELDDQPTAAWGSSLKQHRAQREIHRVGGYSDFI